MAGHHSHSHEHGEHGHSHGRVHSSIVRSKTGVKTVSISFAVLLAGSILQFIIFGRTHSVALLADVIHNAGDSLTAIPLGLAFWLRSSKGERWAGYSVVFVIFISAFLALHQVIEKFIHPQTPKHLWVLIAGGILGVAANEAAAIIRWRTGKRIDSPALIADGNHAKVDGYVSAGVIIGAIFIALGFPIADPLVGLIITGLILQSSWQSWRTIRDS